ncbi:restriction endonuclease subunit S [Chromohalobacter sp. 296-RDG]|uniref:restriction endonuclease subunit S n=1 Tax=Chromohalobacter sp. 296-RDG TaxID=2994062 RepID=UPI00246964CA|nr:restriction endonuclease subunit S [Chromohalobacter sp. 296-RDG]
MSETTLRPGYEKPEEQSLPDDWAVLRLHESCTFHQGGKLGITKSSGYVTSGAPAYSAAGQDGYVSQVEFTNTDGVVLSAIGANCGRCFFASGDWTTLANIQAIIPSPNKLDAKYLYYRVNRESYWPRSGSAQPFIKPSDIRSCWIAHPPVRQQRLIARILDTLDTQIQKTEALIAKLEKVKEGLLHDLLTRGIDDNGQLRPSAEQAPELYKESPLGLIPRAWVVRPLEDYTSSEITYGIVQAGPHVEGGIPYIRTGDMSGDYLDASQLLRTSPSIAANYKRSEVSAGDLVVSIRATVGKVLPVPGELAGANLTQGTAKIAPSRKVDRDYLIWAMRSKAVREAIDLEVKGSTFKEITLAALRQVPLASPSNPSEQVQIGKALQDIGGVLSKEYGVLEKLKVQKHGLMDDLLTGRARVTPLLEKAQATTLA